MLGELADLTAAAQAEQSELEELREKVQAQEALLRGRGRRADEPSQESLHRAAKQAAAAAAAQKQLEQVLRDVTARERASSSELPRPASTWRRSASNSGESGSIASMPMNSRPLPHDEHARRGDGRDRATNE
jgi:hypothetical protein